MTVIDFLILLIAIPSLLGILHELLELSYGPKWIHRLLRRFFS